MGPLDNDGMKCEIKMQLFSDALRRFHERLFTFSWEEQFPGLVFIRDYEELPVRAPFDIDIVSPPAVWTNLDAVFGSLAEELSLVMISHRSAHSFPILIFDPVVPARPAGTYLGVLRGSRGILWLPRPLLLLDLTC